MKIHGVVTPGHGVASGKSRDPRFPQGTLRTQLPLFKARGLDLDLENLHPGTINVSIHPRRFAPGRPDHTFTGVKWCEDFPPETFSFIRCRLAVAAAQPVSGWIYYPHPETKPDHFRDDSTFEILAPFLPGIETGTPVALEFLDDQITIIEASS